MLFNSPEFVLFFPIVAIIFFLLPYRLRWVHLLISSCLFYMAFIPVYIFILFFTIIVDYVAGIMIENARGKRRQLFLLLSICANIGVLSVFKYYNFFAENINALMDAARIHHHEIANLNIILPLGLSFHTFQAMSYTIEVYRGNQSAERHFGIYSLYVMFFPQLTAGPIERPQNLLHQFYEKFDLNYERMRSGFMMMVCGFFMKCVIADRLALYVNPVYGHLQDFHGLSIWVANLFFAFQIYSDFAGYSFIAIGSARVIGFTLMKNFDNPFMGKNVTEFWRRWHISLSTWFNDYLFQPFLVTHREWGKWAVVAGLALTFTLSGLWHGAGWAFIVWGLLHAMVMVYEFLTKKNRLAMARKLPPVLYNNASRLLTFSFLVFAWIFFRAANFHDAVLVMRNALDFHSSYAFKIGFFKRDVYDISDFDIIASVVLIALLVSFDAFRLNRNNLEEKFFAQPAYIRWPVYYGLLLCIFEFGIFSKTKFVYFQF